MIQAFITTASNEVPKMFETGWDWWAWPIAWAALAVAALVIAGALPMFAVVVGAAQDTVWKVPAAILVILVVLAAVVAGYIGSGVMMRHMDNGQGAFWVFLGCLLVGLLGWAFSASWHGTQPYTYEARRWVGRVAAAPALVIGLGAVFNGIAEIITRLAASIPMTVAQFGALVVVGALVLGAYANSSSRR
ncbi:hypothetical protein [Paenarthrobacter sp. NPDC090522]|uniref:hypothetical protein n=1 Tax=Paenarthrobacter sp. NPDC090522 TaxID=3364383 RepID=UPI0037FFB5A9